MHDTVLDQDDGLPVWHVAAGASLVDGQLALDRLAVGLRCETWLAWSVPMWCAAVVKMARPHQVEHPRARLTLGREVAALAGAMHPGLPRLFIDGRDRPVPHLVFEYIAGPALDEELESGPLSSTEVAQFAVQLLAALAVVHERGLAHVDVKPDNVLLRNGQPVLLDFGSARAIGAKQPAGRPIGTPGYAAPELEAGVPISATMDLYGIGVTLFEALAGTPAFDPHVPAGDRPRPAALPAAVATGLAATVCGLLQPDPADRPEFAELMRELAATVPDELARPWPDWADRHLQRRFGSGR